MGQTIKWGRGWGWADAFDLMAGELDRGSLKLCCLGPGRQREGSVSRAGNRKPRGRSGGFEGLLAWRCPAHRSAGRYLLFRKTVLSHSLSSGDELLSWMGLGRLLCLPTGHRRKNKKFWESIEPWHPVSYFTWVSLGRQLLSRCVSTSVSG